MDKNAALRFITWFVNEYATTISCYPSIAMYQSSPLPRHAVIFIQLKAFGSFIRRNILITKNYATYRTLDIFEDMLPSNEMFYLQKVVIYKILK